MAWRVPGLMITASPVPRAELGERVQQLGLDDRADYVVSDPSQIGKIFLVAFARRICASAGGCAAP